MGKGCEENHRESKYLHDSRKLRKVVATLKTNKLVLSKK